MGFVGIHQIYTIVANDLVKRVSDWDKLTTSINTALDAVVSKITDLGPAWAVYRNVPAGTDMNLFRVPGIHRISTPNVPGMFNLPPGMRSAAVVENIITGAGTDTWWAQRITEQGPDPKTWWRSSYDLVGGWNPWVPAGDQGAAVTEWHVFVLTGQSNMSGRGGGSSAAMGKYMSHRIAQFGFSRRVLEPATVPLDMHDNATGISPGTAFAQNYLLTQPSHVGILLVPAAHGGTAFLGSPYSWTPNNGLAAEYDLPASAVKQTQDAIAAATAAGTTVVLKGMLWHQGEGNGALSTASYANQLDQLIAYFRTQLDAPNLPFVVGQMGPEGIVANSPGRANVDLAHRQTPDRVRLTGFAPATTNGYNPGDFTHMSKVGVDYLGRTYMEAFLRSLENVNPPELSGTVAPNGNVWGGIGAEYTNTTGAAGSIRWVSKTAWSNTGWVALW